MSCKYPQITDPQLNDKPLLWDSSNDAWRLCTLTDIYTLFEATTSSGLDTVYEADTQYATPVATDFNITVAQNDHDTHLIITPALTLAAGTIILPPVANIRDKQLLVVNCTQQITALTIDGNGVVAVNGGPSSLGADDFFTLKYDSTMSAWNRIG